MADLGPVPTSTAIGPLEAQMILAVIAVFKQGPMTPVPGKVIDPIQLARVEAILAKLVETERVSA